MKRKRKYVGKRVGAVLLAVSMIMTMPSQMIVNAATTQTTSSTFNNPVIYSDVPDLDIIRAVSCPKNSKISAYCKKYGIPEA